MTKHNETLAKFASLVVVGVIVHKATAKQAASLGLPPYSATLATMAATAMLSGKLA